MSSRHFMLGYCGYDDAWDPSQLTGLVDEWDADAAYCTTDAAADLDRTSSQYFTKASPTFTPTTKMTVAFTFHCTSLSSNSGVGVARWGGGQNQFIPFLLTSGTLDFYLGSSRARFSTTFTTGTTYRLVLVYDGTQETAADRVQGYVDGVDDSVSQVGTWPTTLPASTANLTIGRNDDGGDFDGWIQCVGISSDALTGAALTAAHTATFYEDMTAARQADWDAGFWNLNQASGAATDSTGTNDLTAVNSPGVAAGVASGTVQDRSPVKTWTGKVNGVDFTRAADIAEQPIWIESGKNGLPTIRPDGTDDYLACDWDDLTSPVSVFLVTQYPGASNERMVGGINTGDRIILDDNAGGFRLFAGSNLFASSEPSAEEDIIVSAVANGASSKIRWNGGNEGTGDAGSNGADGVHLFAGSTGAQNADGDMSHVIVMDAAATDDEIANVEAFLNTRYAVY